MLPERSAFLNGSSGNFFDKLRARLIAIAEIIVIVIAGINNPPIVACAALSKESETFSSSTGYCFNTLMICTTGTKDPLFRQSMRLWLAH